MQCYEKKQNHNGFDSMEFLILLRAVNHL